MITIILLALGGAVIAAVVGTIWYSPGTPMGRLHMQYLGFDKLTPEEQQRKIAEAKPTMWKLYAGQFVLSLITAVAVVFIVQTSMQNGVPFGVAAGFVALNWLCFMVPVVGSALLWSNCDRTIVWKKFFSDIFSHLVILMLVALMASFFL